MTKLEQMLAGCTGDAQRARVWYELWRLAPSHSFDGQQAADLYRGLPPTDIYGVIRRYYREVTGEAPPSPPALLTLPEIVHQPSATVEQLLRRTDRVLTALDAASH